MSTTAFRNAVISSMQDQSASELCVARLTDESFRVGPSMDDCEYHAFVDGAYAEYTDEPERADEIIASLASNYVSVISEGIDESNFEARLVVQLRAESYAHDVDASDDASLVARPFAGDLIAVLMLDSAQTLAAVSASQLADHGITEDQAFEMAKANTRSRMGDVLVDEYRKINFLSSSNGLISGQMWLPETCDGQSADAVYFLYDRNGVMKVGLDNPLGVSNLLSVANGLVIQGEAMTSSVVRCKNGQWTQLWPTRSADFSGANPYQPG
ncbi:MAG: hypothetical protein CMK07_14690 [Ponticaulis sp.]|nr:hypothetical protein [Ponticaulis sp.]